MPKGKERKHTLHNLKKRMDERGETPYSLSRKTDTVSGGRILALVQGGEFQPTNEAYKALDHEVLELANALACYPEHLIDQPKDPAKMHTQAGGRRGRMPSVKEEFFGDYPEYGW